MAGQCITVQIQSVDQCQGSLCAARVDVTLQHLSVCCCKAEDKYYAHLLDALLVGNALTLDAPVLPECCVENSNEVHA